MRIRGVRVKGYSPEAVFNPRIMEGIIISIDRVRASSGDNLFHPRKQFFFPWHRTRVRNRQLRDQASKHFLRDLLKIFSMCHGRMDRFHRLLAKSPMADPFDVLRKSLDRFGADDHDSFDEKDHEWRERNATRAFVHLGCEVRRGDDIDFRSWQGQGVDGKLSSFTSWC